MALNYGVTISEVDTKLSTITGTDSSLPVFIGTAPVWRVGGSLSPVIINSRDEYEQHFGKITNPVDGVNPYTLAEVADYWFNVSGASRAIFINALDYEARLGSQTSKNVTVAVTPGKNRVATELQDVVITSVTTGGEIPVPVENVVIDCDKNGNVYLDIPFEEATSVTLHITYKPVDIDEEVTIDELQSAIAKIDDIYTNFGLIPAQITCPRYSCLPSVAASLLAKAKNVAGEYTALAIMDLATTSLSLAKGESTETAVAVSEYTGIATGLAGLGVSDTYAVICWPCGKIGNAIYSHSIVKAAENVHIDADNFGVPFRAPSNNATGLTAACLLDGTDILLDKIKANQVRELGVCTLLRRPLTGLSTWGAYTAAANTSSDVKEYFINIRRMYIYIGNSLIANFFSKVDQPANKIQIENVKNSANQWLNGLIGLGALINGHVDFLDLENTDATLLQGLVRFHVYLTIPVPMQQIDFILEYDTSANALTE